MTLLNGLLATIRPRQWVKNLLVFLPLLFAVDLVWSPEDLSTLRPHVVALLILFAGFCALSSAVYIINDLADRPADRQHPVKRNRPIASGAVTPVWAVAGAALLILMAVGIMVGLERLVSSLLGVWVVGAIYLAINVAYSMRLKRIALVDVVLVATGYVLRAAAGAIAVGAAPSPWLYAVTASGALFIVIGRRYAEARLSGEDSGAQRTTLLHYGPPLGGQLLTLSATAALVSYALYTVEAPNLPVNHTMLLTVPLVILGLFRYLYLLNHSVDAESPELLIMRDVPLLVAIAAWIGTSAAVLMLN